MNGQYEDEVEDLTTGFEIIDLPEPLPAREPREESPNAPTPEDGLY